MDLTHVVLAAEWGLFIAIWVVCSFIFRTSGQKKCIKVRLLYPCIAFFLITAIAYLGKDYFSKKFTLPGLLGEAGVISGMVLAGGGLSFAAWSRITLAGAWSGIPAFIEGQAIIKKGPYAKVRHPIYTGVIAMLWGSFFAGGFLFLLLAALFGSVMLYFKARLEEALLLEHLGDEYGAFMRAIPMLLPSVRFRKRQNPSA